MMTKWLAAILLGAFVLPSAALAADWNDRDRNRRYEHRYGDYRDRHEDRRDHRWRNAWRPYNYRNYYSNPGYRYGWRPYRYDYRDHWYRDHRRRDRFRD